MSRISGKALADAKADEHRRKAEEFEDYWRMRARLICLSENLARAAMLERAYDLGSEHGRWQNATLGFDDTHPWWSNVDGKPAP